MNFLERKCPLLDFEKGIFLNNFSREFTAVLKYFEKLKKNLFITFPRKHSCPSKIYFKEVHEEWRRIYEIRKCPSADKIERF